MGNTENKVMKDDNAIHDWYRFVLSFPPHLVRQYIKDFGADKSSYVLDPFCGTGTTNVECKKNRIASLGIEASPITHFASKVKCSWITPSEKMLLDAQIIADEAREQLTLSGPMLTLPDSETQLLLKNSISDKPLNDAIILRDAINSSKSQYKDYFLLAFAKHLVQSYSNLKFGPEVGISRRKKTDVDVVGIWLSQVQQMIGDLEEFSDRSQVESTIVLSDSRMECLDCYNGKVDCVITSPPYPNEKDYSRTTRLEAVMLGFIKSKEELRNTKKSFIRSNTKNVYKNDTDERFVERIKSINELSQAIEERRLDLNKTSGFEKLYSRVVKLYFGGMARHLESIKPLLKDGAHLAYVVGDQASYFQIPIRTSFLLGEVAESLGGYKVERIDTFRKRYATATGIWLNEDVLILSYERER